MNYSYLDSLASNGPFSWGPQPQQPNPLSGLLGEGFDDPRTQGLLGLSAALLQASGPSTRPTSLGQALGQGMGAYTQARTGAQNALDDRALKRELIDVKKQALGKAPDSPSSVQEWMYYNRLSLEDQKRYLEMKRNPNILNFGDSLATLGPGGKPVSLGPVNLKPGERPDVRAAQTTATERAKAEEEARQGLGSAVDDINKMRGDINGLLQAPGFDTIYGASGKLDPRNYLAGTDASNASARREQLDAASFGMSIQKMKGMGSLSDAEGKKVSAAFTRATNPKISEDEARKAWGEVLDYLNLAEKRANEKAGVKPSAKKATNIDDLLKKYGR